MSCPTCSSQEAHRHHVVQVATGSVSGMPYLVLLRADGTVQTIPVEGPRATVVEPAPEK